MIEFKDVCRSENIENKLSYFKNYGAICDPNNKYIQSVPFCQLSEYWFYLQPNGPDTNFVDNADIDKAIVSYVFDMEIKSLIMKAIQNIEKSLKQCLTEHVYQYDSSNSSLKRGAWIDEKYIDFRCGVHNSENMGRFNMYKRFLNNVSTVSNEMQKKGAIKKERVDDYRIINKMSFGNVKTIYKIANTTMKEDIASRYSMISWQQFQVLLDVINTIRNKSAHYERLWNTNIGGFINVVCKEKEKNHVLDDVITRDKYTRQKIYNALVWIIYMLNQIDSSIMWKHEFLSLIKKYEERNYTQRMGFRPNWRNLDFWK